MRHSSHPPQTALRPHPTRFIYLSLDGRAYSGLGWRTSSTFLPPKRGAYNRTLQDVKRVSPTLYTEVIPSVTSAVLQFPFQSGFVCVFVVLFYLV